MAKKKRNWYVYGCVAIISACIGWGFGGKSDNYIRSRVVQLTNTPGGSCSGEQIIAPSGENYIITAGHCRTLEEDGSINVTTEDGKQLKRKVIAEDTISDLLLIEGLPKVKGLNVAESDSNKERIRTFTHGYAFETYETDGVLIQERQVTVPFKLIVTDKDRKDCEQPKYSIKDFDGETICFLDVKEVATTAFVVPGSSGGVVIDSYGDVVGVVSATDGRFGYLVTLKDIKNFLKGY